MPFLKALLVDLVHLESGCHSWLEAFAQAQHERTPASQRCQLDLQFSHSHVATISNYLKGSNRTYTHAAAVEAMDSAATGERHAPPSAMTAWFPY